MKIKYTNTKEEMIKYDFKEIENSAELKSEFGKTKKLYGFLALLVALIGVYSIIRGLSLETTDPYRAANITRGISFLFMALITLTFSWIYKKIRLFFIKRELKSRDYSSLGEVEVEVTPKTINWAYKGQHGSIKQTEDIKIRDENDTLVIVTRKHNFIVPKRIFEDEESLEEFKKAIDYDRRLVK